MSSITLVVQYQVNACCLQRELDRIFGREDLRKLFKGAILRLNKQKINESLQK
jgi:hypothetical protein